MALTAGELTDGDALTQIASLTDGFFRAVSFQNGDRPEYSRIHNLFIDAGLLIKNSTDPQMCRRSRSSSPRARRSSKPAA